MLNISNRLLNFILRIDIFFKQLIVLTVDVLLSVISIFSVCLILGRWELLSSDKILYLIAISLVFIPIFISLGLYRAIFRYFNLYTVFRIFYAIIIYNIIFIFIIFFNTKINDLAIAFLQPIFFFISVFFFRVFIVLIYDNVLKIKTKQKILLYGAGDVGSYALNYLKNLNIAGFIDDDISKNKRRLNGYKIYHTNNLQEVIKNYNINQVIITIPNLDFAKRRYIISRFERHNIEVLFFPSVFEILDNKINIKDFERANVSDLIDRKITINTNEINKFIFDKKVLITGAGGSIGSEIVRQVLNSKPSEIILIDQNEYNLYKIEKELNTINLTNQIKTKVSYILCSIQNSIQIKHIFNLYRPQIVFHAAAYKHVPLAEKNIFQYILNNVLGTFILAKEAINIQVENFLFISTDKAVRPNNIMGASKRIAEMILLNLSNSQQNTLFSIVRFGNVLGSIGSVLPLFKEQLSQGNFLTVTHPNVTRYFMTINEAVNLVLNSLTMTKGGEVYVLNMGKPIKILDLAKKMIKLYGYKEKKDKKDENGIEIKFTGLRPGEKLYEELLIGQNPIKTENPDIFMEKNSGNEIREIDIFIDQLRRCIDENNTSNLLKLIEKNVDGFNRHYSEN